MFLILPKYEGITPKPTPEKGAVLVGQSISSAYCHGYHWFNQKPVACSISGIQNLEIAIQEYLCEGGYICDKRDISIENALKVIDGPMDKITLPPMTLDDWGVVSTFDSMQLFFNFPKIRDGLSLATTYLSIDLYCAWWQKLGARIGRYIDGQIIWQEQRA